MERVTSELKVTHTHKANCRVKNNPHRQIPATFTTASWTTHTLSTGYTLSLPHQLCQMTQVMLTQEHHVSIIRHVKSLCVHLHSFSGSPGARKVINIILPFTVLVKIRHLLGDILLIKRTCKECRSTL